MASGELVDYPKRDYIDFTEIDMTEFGRWKINREDSIKGKKNMDKEILAESKKKHFK